MTFGSTFGRTFSPTFQPKSQAAEVASSWWLAGGIDPANCVAVYNLWGSANAELQNASFIAQLLSRCG